MPTTSELLRRADALENLAGDRPVSSRSRFEDPRWYLDAFGPSLPLGGLTLYWQPGSEMPEGQRPDEVDTAIDMDLRRLVWCAMADPRVEAARKITGAVPLVTGCVSLRRFMRERGLASLAELTPAVCEIYVDWLEEHCATDTEEGDAASETDDDGADDVWDGTEALRLKQRIGLRLRTLTLAWELRDTLARAGVPVPPADPLSGRPVSEIVGVVVRRMEDRIPPVPDEVFVRIANACLLLMEEHAEEILGHQETWLNQVGPELGGQAERNDAASALRSVRLSPSGGRHLLYPTHLEQDMENPTASIWAPQGLRRLVVALRDACLVLVQSTAGLRTGELLSIRGGQRPGNALPDCIVRRRTDDGLFDLFFVTSTLEKGRTVPVIEEWLLGMAPSGSTQQPPAVRALAILERLSSPWRALSADPAATGAIAVAFSSGGGMPMEPGRVHRLTTGRYAHSCGNLAHRFVDLSGLPARSAAGEDLTPYVESRGRCIRPAQYRKNFGKFVLRVDSRLATALKAHFKHMSLATTERSYIGRRAGSMIGGFDERRLLSEAAFRAMLGDEDDGAGSLGRTIARDAERFGLGARSIEAAEAFAASGGLLIPGEHGACGCALAPLLSRCNRMAGTASFANTEPNPAFRSPDVCIGCPLYLVDGSNIPFWRRRHLVNERLWRQARRSGLEDDYRVARQRSEHAQAMLRRLGWKRAG